MNAPVTRFLTVLTALAVSTSFSCAQTFQDWKRDDVKAFNAFARGLSAEQETLRRDTREALAALDGSRSASLTDREFILSVFRQIIGTEPALQELTTFLRLLQGDRDRACFVRIGRSQLVGLLYSRKLQRLPMTYADVADVLPLVRGLDLTTKPGPHHPPPVRPERPHTTPPELGLLRNDGEYNVYRGYMHSHTELSDGIGTPAEAYAMARDRAGLDFFAVTDHAVFLPAWPWEAKYESIIAAADAANRDGTYAALFGFEWTSPVFGHINIMGARDFTTCVNTWKFSDICQWVAERPDTIAQFNHPGDLNFVDMQFEAFALYPQAVEQFVMMEMFNSDKGIEEYFDKGFGDDNRFYDEALLNGWSVAASGGQDNHGGDWGLRNAFTVGVWAETLTRDRITSALRARRSFASEDGNLSLSFRIGGAEMGSRLSPGPATAVLTMLDADSEPFTVARLYRKGRLIKEWTAAALDPELHLAITPAAGDYFYVLVRQADGDLALSSPIWMIR